MKSGYVAISTKIRAMYAGHLEIADYEQLLKKNSVGEICAYLKQSAEFKEALQNVNELNVHRGDLETSLEQIFKNHYSGLYNFADLQKKRMLRFIFMKEELDFLKRAVMYAMSEESETNLRIPYPGDAFFQQHTRIDLEAVKRAGSLSDIVEGCRDTPYYDILNRVSMNASDPATVLMLLDRYYFERLWRAKNRYVEKAGREAFTRYIGSDIDALNVLWIYRCKKYFKTSNEFIYTYIIPIYYHLSEADIAGMVDAQDLGACEQAIRNTTYAYLLDRTNGTAFMDGNYARKRYQAAKKAYQLHPLSMTEIFAFFDLKAIELASVKTIIEGIRYQVDPQTIRENIYIG